MSIRAFAYLRAQKQPFTHVLRTFSGSLSSSSSSMSDSPSSAPSADPGSITADSKCAGCSSFVDAMSAEEVKAHQALIPTWTVDETYSKINKSIKVKNFAVALQYINEIGKLAEIENHHPDLTIRSYNFVDVTLSTHALKGLTSNDFILAVKIDTIPVQLSKSKPKSTNTSTTHQ